LFEEKGQSRIVFQALIVGRSLLTLN